MADRMEKIMNKIDDIMSNIYFEFLPIELKKYLQSIYMFIGVIPFLFLILLMSISIRGERNLFYIYVQILAGYSIITPFLIYLFNHEIKDLISISFASLACIGFVTVGHVGLNVMTLIPLLLSVFLLIMANVICFFLHVSYEKDKRKNIFWALGGLWAEIFIIYGLFYMISRFFY